MLDLDEIPEMFARLEGCAEAETDDVYRSTIEYRRSFRDPHRDADRFLAASPEQRDAMRPAFEAKLFAVRRELARRVVPASSWEERHREYRKQRARERRAAARAVRQVEHRATPKDGRSTPTDPERLRATWRARYLADAEAKRAARRARYRAKAEQVREAERQRYQANPEPKREYMRQRRRLAKRAA